MGVTWIASYPKSGNTWVRFLLANYFAGPIGDSAQVGAAVPSISPVASIERLLATHSPLCMKTHFPWSAKHPFADRTDRAIIIVRYPKDILLSNLNYHRMLAGCEGGFSDETYAKAFIAAGADPAWLDHFGYGTLEAHVASWLDDPSAPPRLLIRYEDLARDAGAELERILAFIGVEADAGRVRAAADASSFDEMRRMESREKAAGRITPVFPGKSPRNGWARFFVNQGRTGSSLAHIHPELDRMFEHRFGALMQRLGYDALANGSPYLFAPPAAAPRADGLSQSA